MSSKTTLSIDVETFSEAPLTGARSVGLVNYLKHPSTELLMVAYAWNDGPVEQVDLTAGERVPPEVREGLVDPDIERWAYNASFERLVTKLLLKLDTPYENWRCTQALAYARSFSGGLGDVAGQMELDSAHLKDKRGKQLIQLFSVPQIRRTRDAEIHSRCTRKTHPTEWQAFLDYNRQDVVAETAIKKELLRYPFLDSEWDLYSIDQRINDRGLPIDLRFVSNAARMAKLRKEELTLLLERVTGLSNPNSQVQLLPWLKRQNYPYDDLQKATITKALLQHKNEPVLTEICVAALNLRQQANRISVAKYAAIEQRISSDNTIKHCFQFAGASRTNRWAGRSVQPQNLGRTPKFLEGKVELASELISQDDYHGIKDRLNGEVMAVLAGSVRSSIKAKEGYKLVVCDLSAIESAVLAWLSGCKRVLEVFAQGRDIYKDFGVEMFKKPYEDVTKEERTISKPAVLGCFAADTLVLTDSGWKPIVEVASSDLVYDGVEFVKHDGVIYQGVRNVIDMRGVLVTPEHEILTGDGWRTAWQLCQNSLIEQRAINLACGLLRNFSEGDAESGIIVADAKVAENNGVYTDLTWRRESLGDVRSVQVAPGMRETGASIRCSMRRVISSMCSLTGITLSSLDVAAHIVRLTQIMAGVGSRTVLSLSMSLSDTACSSMGAALKWNSIVLTTTGTTIKAISGSLRDRPIPKILGRSIVFAMQAASIRLRRFGVSSLRLLRTARLSSVNFVKGCHQSRLSPTKVKSAVRVFDIAECGPRQRFVISTDAGPMIAHNCGFGLGGGMLRDGKRTGLWGYAEALGVEITNEEAIRQVKLFRDTYPEIVKFWQDLDDGCRTALRGKTAHVGRITMEMRGKFMTVRLPSGRLMFYLKPYFQDKTFVNKDGEEYVRSCFTYEGIIQGTKQWGRVVSSSPKLCENVVQATARDVLGAGMLNAHRYGFRLVGTVHDEIQTMQKQGRNYYNLEALRQCMTENIPWATGLPLAAEGYESVIYKKD